MGKGTTLRCLAAAGLIVASLAGCSHGRAPEQADAEVELRDFKITLDHRQVHAGEVRLALENYGPTVHELVVARTDRRSGRLPIGEDGLSVSEEADGVTVVDEVEEVQLAQQGALDVHLRPGHYVLFCNLEGHYLGGMHSDLEVVG